MNSAKYSIEIRDARGVVIGDGNVVYQYFLPENYRPLAEHFLSFDDLILIVRSFFLAYCEFLPHFGA